MGQPIPGARQAPEHIAVVGDAARVTANAGVICWMTGTRIPKADILPPVYLSDPQ
ncbi:hypothetical protein HEK616_79500 (plasmid) [Streptomyces nigrescens]|uniref:Uncharacterized protein n=1 Tax=Streptomyces nigrescens TaxID=1920 RepID=A0ABN6RB97_STRNI|nr:hypothetical protein HEK616_79500 [Streptomyces nigrescens]